MPKAKRGIAPRIVHRIWYFSILPLQNVENYDLYIVDNFDGIVLREEIYIVQKSHYMLWTSLFPKYAQCS